jgi:uncharacterized protein (DUF488 family)
LRLCKSMAHPFYTIGHGRRPVGEFIDLLRSVEVTLLVDVRTVPGSRTNPQYNRDQLAQTLASSEIDYEHVAALGGLRGRERHVPSHLNAYWENESFHNYADYATSDRFRDGLENLRERGRRQRCAIACAETVWWRCHRRIITDHLLAAGETVFHLLAPGRVEAATINLAARVQADGKVIYPAESAPPQRGLFDQ